LSDDDLTQVTVKDALRLLRMGSVSAADMVTAHVGISDASTLTSRPPRFTPEQEAG
jgi:hypothetical protein